MNKQSANSRQGSAGRFTRSSAHRQPRARLGFNLIELLVALAISAALLTATLVALNASYTAYQRTTKAASTHTISRLTMDRIMTLIRTGEAFPPPPGTPVSPTGQVVFSNSLDVITPYGDGYVIGWDPNEEELYIATLDPNTWEPVQPFHVLLDNVTQYNPDNPGNPIPPFTLEYERGYILNRATVHLVIESEEDSSLTIEGNRPFEIRLVSTAMPRRIAYGN